MRYLKNKNGLTLFTTSMKTLFFIAFPVLFTARANEINESLLMTKIRENSHQVNTLKAQGLLNEITELQTNELYNTDLYLETSYYKTKEQALIPMNPVFSPILDGKIGIRKNHDFGLSSDLSLTNNIKSSTSGTTKYNDLSSSTLQYSLKMDIWKDFLGRTTKAQLSNLNLESKKADLQTKIAIKNFEIQMRRLYWSLVANNESLKISDELLKSANSLLAESKKRFQNSIAEKDEVARYEALVAQRKGSILLLEFQRENLIQTLKLALPELGTEIQLGQYNIDDTITKVLACTETISSEASTPNHFTSYDELAEMLKTIKENQKTVTSRYDDTNALLFGSVKATGTSSNPNGANEYNGSLSNAFSDLSNNKRSGFLVGLNITIPLGDAKNRTQSVKEAYDRLSLDSEIEKIQSNNNATHSQLVKSIRILNEVLRAQKINSAQLKIRIDGVRKKYIQARASVDDLINDQDSLLSSELTTIETRLKILNTIFDYLTVFNETPCDFNRI